MELIGAGLECDVEERSGDGTELSGEVAGLDCNFLNGIQARLAVLLRDLPNVACGVLAFNAMNCVRPPDSMMSALCSESMS